MRGWNYERFNGALYKNINVINCYFQPLYYGRDSSPIVLSSYDCPAISFLPFESRIGQSGYVLSISDKNILEAKRHVEGAKYHNFIFEPKTGITSSNHIMMLLTPEKKYSKK